MPKGCNFIALQTLIQQLYYWQLLYFIAFNYRAIFDTYNVERSEAHVLKGCIQNCSIVKVYNKVLIINHVRMSGSMIALMGKNRNFFNICFTSQTPSRPLHSKKNLKFILAHCGYLSPILCTRQIKISPGF